MEEIQGDKLSDYLFEYTNKLSKIDPQKEDYEQL